MWSEIPNKGFTEAPGCFPVRAKISDFGVQGPVWLLFGLYPGVASAKQRQKELSGRPWRLRGEERGLGLYHQQFAQPCTTQSQGLGHEQALVSLFPWVKSKGVGEDGCPGSSWLRCCLVNLSPSLGTGFQLCLRVVWAGVSPDHHCAHSSPL